MSIPLVTCMTFGLLLWQSIVTASAASINVAAADNIFWSTAEQSSRVVISLGDKVVWKNTGSTIHNVNADDNSWASVNMAPGAQYSHVFSKAGDFPYRCTLHEAEEMFGVVSVRSAAIATPAHRVVLPTTKPK